jgi:hypothetical protein
VAPGRIANRAPKPHEAGQAEPDARLRDATRGGHLKRSPSRGCPRVRRALQPVAATGICAVLVAYLARNARTGTGGLTYSQ